MQDIETQTRVQSGHIYISPPPPPPTLVEIYVYDPLDRLAIGLLRVAIYLLAFGSLLDILGIL